MLAERRRSNSQSIGVSSRAKRTADRATARVKQALLKERHALEIRGDESKREKEEQSKRMKREMEAFEVKAAIMILDAEDDAINTVEAEAGRATHAPPATPATMAPISLAPPSTPAMPPHSTVPTQVATGGAIPKRPRPGLPSPPATSVVNNLDNLRAPSASHTGVGARGADTAVLDTVLPGPALTGGVSVPTPAPGYGYVGYHRRAEGSPMYNGVVAPPAEVHVTASSPPTSVGYYPDSRRCPPANMYMPPVATAREQPPGNSAPCTDTRSNSTGPCNDQLAQLIGVLQAPAVIIPTFSGDPISYQRFIRAFEDNVERVISDDASRLARVRARLHASLSAAY